MKTVTIRVMGKVQGVYFRQSTCDKARSLQLTGSVKNEPDGSVYIIASGPEEGLQQLVLWCHTGPPGAVVNSVQTAPLPYKVFTRFSIDR